MEEPGYMPVMEPEKTFEPRGDDEALVWVIERRQNENVSALQTVCEALAKTLAHRVLLRVPSTQCFIPSQIAFPTLMYQVLILGRAKQGPGVNSIILVISLPPCEMIAQETLMVKVCIIYRIEIPWCPSRIAQ